ncbi:MAG: hypothetical protein KC466_19375, partial [Myxococcales bacterium]|nr:hypothetical protein [Myxococcales bacterium]
GPNLPSVALLGDAFGFLDVTWSGAIADGACHLDPEVENASLGGNVERDATCGFVAPGDHRNADARLGPLGDNGGPTPTHLPGAGSPALGAVPADQCPPTDQRGEPRPQGSAPACDAGAAEVDEEAPGCAPMGHGSASPLALAPFALAFAVLRRTRRRSP